MLKQQLPLPNYIKILTKELTVSINKKYYFLDRQYGIFYKTLSKVLYRKSYHKNRTKETKTKPSKWTLPKVRQALRKKNIYIVKHSYTKFEHKAIFIDKDYGTFTTTPYHIIVNGGSHPIRSEQRRRATCVEKYGVPYFQSTSTHKQKVKKTFLGRYGVDNNMKCPKLAIKNALSQNKAGKTLHWKTNEELVWVGSYEKKVIDYLNTNKIEFVWQPITVSMIVNNKTTTYRPDLYLVSERKWVEIKGYPREDAMMKWWIFTTLVSRSEMWDKYKLKELEIL